MNDEDAHWGAELDAYLDAYVEEELEDDRAAAQAAYARFDLDVTPSVEPPPIWSRTRRAAMVAAVVALAAGLVGVWLQSSRSLDPEDSRERGGQAADVVDSDAPDQVASPRPMPRSQPRRTKSSVEPESAPDPLPPEPEPEPEPRVEKRKPRTPEPAVEPEPSSLARELASLRTLRTAAQAGDYAGVLSRARAHRRDFSRPTMAAERDLIELEALCGLGRLNDVARAKAAFAQAHPKHHLRSKAERVCVAE